MQDIIDKGSWVIGGQNFDEDIHFSSFYIRLSSKKYLRNTPNAGYHTVVAVYEDFNEMYYVPTSDCEKVSKWLLFNVKRKPEWMSSIVGEIYRQCDQLAKVFTSHGIYLDFSALSNQQIVKLYHKHFATHWKLYEVARIPEALDRGTQTFTNYLRTYLAKRCKTSDPREINELFCILTTPLKPSIFQEEFFEFLDIVEGLQSNERELFLNQDRLAFLKTSPTLLRKIHAHMEKWGFLEYHGYGSRKTPNLDHYVRRIGSYLSLQSPWKGKEEFEKQIDTVAVNQVELYSKYKVDEKHQQLLRLYWEIGLAKLYRRFIQLRNFYFLDGMIHEIALRTDNKEGIIRCLLPEEVLDLLHWRLAINENIKDRMEFAVHFIDGEAESLVSGAEYRWVKLALESRRKSSQLNANELYGTPASLGYAEGTCKVIIRTSDAIKKEFKDGEILVSEATDPDLAQLIERAGGVVTQQGGVTSHASIICRELGKPALVGVQNLLDVVRDFDQVKLDAYAGKLILLQKAKESALVIRPEQVTTPLIERIGNKAYALALLKKAGFHIPRFIVVPVDLLLEELGDGISDMKKLLNGDLMVELNRACSEFTTRVCVIRSSFLVEDEKTSSKAGHFPTLVGIETSKLHEQLGKYISLLHTKFGGVPSGGIIIQEMIDGQVSGVCFTVDPRLSDANMMVIEAVQGSNFDLTAGIVTPDIRITMTKDTFDISSTESLQEKYLIMGSQIREVAKISLEIERYFSHPQDIEWSIQEDIVWILQSRPVTTL